MALVEGDTACVTFPGTSGATLDSLRIGLRRKGSLALGVWSKGITGSPLGAPLAVGLSAISSGDPMDTTTSYPIPWPNWATVNVSSLHIPADQPFAVGLIPTGDPYVNQRPMVTIVGGVTNHSYSFLSFPGQDRKPGWFTLPVGQSPDTNYAYLIRAYVSTLTDVRAGNSAGVAQTFVLEQSYPNPANPTTRIAYVIPSGAGSGSQVVGRGSGNHSSGFSAYGLRLTVYDLLGREVAALVDGEQAPGRHEVVFDAKGLASGIYVYRLTAGTFSASRTLVIVR
jgi:hypothetical protein